jgi:hypothetical protein
MRWHLGAIAVALAGLLPAGAGAQEFPPPEEAMRLLDGQPARSTRFPIGVTFGYGLPSGSIEKGLKLGDVFESVRTVRLDAGLAGKVLGASLYYRHGFPTLGDRWCAPPASCSGSFRSYGVAAQVSVAPRETKVSPVLAIGLGLAEGEVEPGGGAFQRVTAWEVLSSFAVMWRLGDGSSPWRAGASLAVHAMIPDEYETPAGKATVPPETMGTPIWWELGLRASFD